jgi:cystinosin
MVLRAFQRLSLRARVALVTALILVLGLVLGFTLHANAHIPQPWNRLSSVIGWIYFCCWSVSFYPQVFLNYERKSVEGLSLDYTALNLLGFTCYAIFNCAFFYSESVQEQYMRRYNGNRNAVEPNDVFFALHAVVLVAVSLFQCWIYPRGGQRVSKPTIVWSLGTVVVGALFAVAIEITGNDEHSFINTLNLLYLLSYVKLLTTLVKCLPQIYLNYKRKSTIGWTIWNVLLDIAGGLLSIGQQVLDSAATHDWTAITGDPVKFALGFVSIIVDIVFILQHYVWYEANNRLYAGDEKRPLLP